jgi:hypothetical protein
MKVGDLYNDHVIFRVSSSFFCSSLIPLLLCRGPIIATIYAMVMASVLLIPAVRHCAYACVAWTVTVVFYPANQFAEESHIVLSFVVGRTKLRLSTSKPRRAGHWVLLGFSDVVSRSLLRPADGSMHRQEHPTCRARYAR